MISSSRLHHQSVGQCDWLSNTDFFWNQQVNSALALDHMKRQWVDLGIHTEACMTRPETCGEAGGAISLWINVIECEDAAFISTLAFTDRLSTASVIYCYVDEIQYVVSCQIHL